MSEPRDPASSRMYAVEFQRYPTDLGVCILVNAEKRFHALKRAWKLYPEYRERAVAVVKCNFARWVNATRQANGRHNRVLGVKEFQHKCKGGAVQSFDNQGRLLNETTTRYTSDGRVVSTSTTYYSPTGRVTSQIISVREKDGKVNTTNVLGGKLLP